MMNFTRLFVASLAATSSKTLIPASEQHQLEVFLNDDVRATTGTAAANMRYAEYYPPVQVIMDNFVQENTGYWFNIPGNRYTLTQQAGFEDYRNWWVFMHDTTDTGPEAVLGIFKFRWGQRKCYSEPDCSDTSYDNYFSCYASVTPADGNCNYANQYLPIMYQAGMSRFACSLLGVPGINNLHNQNNSFICIMEILDENGNQVAPAIPDNDKSFVDGPRCSKCPKDAKYCYHNALCTISSASPTTSHPSHKPTTVKPTKAITAKPSHKPTTGKPTKPTTVAPSTVHPSKKPTVHKKNGRMLSAFNAHAAKRSNLTREANGTSLVETRQPRRLRNG